MTKKPTAPAKVKPGASPIARKRKSTAATEEENNEPLVKKEVRWMGDSLDVMSAFPDEVKLAGGEELYRVQCGLDANDATPMGDVGKGTYEIRISKAGGWFRVFYVAKFGNAVYVLHAFQKKTNATSKGDIEVGKARYASAEKDAKSVVLATGSDESKK